MNFVWMIVLGVSTSLQVTSPSALSRVAPNDSGHVDRSWLAEGWIGVSLDSRGPFSGVRDRTLVVLGLSFERRLIGFGQLKASYTPTLIPLVGLPNNSSGTVTSVRSGTIAVRESQSKPTIGVGLLPLGLLLSVRISGGLDVGVGGAAGLVVFNHPVPFRNAGRVHFFGDTVVKAGVALTDQMAVRIGYRYQHMSNMGLASVNPGLDANVFFLGVLTGRR